MKRRAWLGSLLMASCDRPTLRVSGGIPRTERSQKAVARVRPELERALAERGCPWGSPLLLRIFKHERELEAWVGDPQGRYTRLLAQRICAMSGALGPKRREGDKQAPEGVYAVVADRLNPASSYHLAMNIGYPNERDLALGCTGSLIMIHGDCASVGCFAMGDEGIEPLYALAEAALEAGHARVPVHVHPFRPGAGGAPNPPDAEASDLWEDLATIHEVFERERRLPEIRVRGARYEIVMPPR